MFNLHTVQLMFSLHASAPTVANGKFKTTNSIFRQTRVQFFINTSRTVQFPILIEFKINTEEKLDYRVKATVQ